MRTPLPLALSVAMWIVGGVWAVGGAALLLGLSWQVPLAALVLGVCAGVAEWLQRSRMR